MFPTLRNTQGLVCRTGKTGVQLVFIGSKVGVNLMSSAGFDQLWHSFEEGTSMTR